MFKVSILDGYVDEPSCLGVPPYISPYPRYIAGAVWSIDKSAQIFYVTIDQLRNDKSLLDVLSESDIIVVIAGMSVPGRYLSGFPVSPNELVSFLNGLSSPLKILCGPAARYGFGMSGGKKTRETYFVENVFDLIVKGDGEIVLSELLKNKSDMDKIDSLKLREHASDIRDFAVTGSSIVCQHPFYPDYLITEIETYRGCSRSIVGGCSFCSEPSKGPPDFRTSIFNMFYQSKKQVVVAGKTSPNQTKNLPPDLRSRMEWGILLELQVTDHTTRMKIIKQKAREENLHILDDVAFFLANTTNDLKILIQFFVSLQTYTSLYQRKIDMSTVKSIIKNTNIYKRSVNDIQKLTSEYFNISISDLLSNKKSRDLSYPRQVGMYLCRKLTDLSFKDIGGAFGNKDHSTVIYAVKRIEKEKNKNQGVLNDINKLQNFLL